jgi:hypothetical protein
MTLICLAGPGYDVKPSTRGHACKAHPDIRGTVCVRVDQTVQVRTELSSKGTGGRKITQVEFVSRWQIGEG